jgi:hypothetical protein
LTNLEQGNAIELQELPHTICPDAHQASGMLMVKTNLVDECVDDPGDSWVMSLGTANPQPKVHVLELSLPEHMPAESSANCAFLNLVQDLKGFGAKQCLTGPWEWRVPGSAPKSQSFSITRKLLGAEPVYPRLAKSGEKHIGFLLPLAEFGGVEKVAYNLARVLRNRG